MSDLYRIGIDIGGTFTDAVVMDEQSGDFHPVKVSSTPDDPSRAFMEAYTRGLSNRGLTSDQIRFVVHGTTVATNTIIQQKGARIGLIASEGFSDLFENRLADPPQPVRPELRQAPSPRATTPLHRRTRTHRRPGRGACSSERSRRGSCRTSTGDRPG